LIPGETGSENFLSGDGTNPGCFARRCIPSVTRCGAWRVSGFDSLILFHFTLHSIVRLAEKPNKQTLTPNLTMTKEFKKLAGDEAPRLTPQELEKAMKECPRGLRSSMFQKPFRHDPLPARQSIWIIGQRKSFRSGF
jgi:hypothetical protein